MPPDERPSAELVEVEKQMSLDDELKPTSWSSIVSPSAHLASTVALCICTLTHSYLLISVYPYSGFMAIELLPFVNEENAGFYAGLIASSFMVGRAASSYGWGKLADTYGRTTVLYLSLGLSCIFSLLFGIARTFGAAVAFRSLLGFSNGIISIAKTAVSELANGNEALETRGMGLVMGMWGWGFLFSPALSGALAEPVRVHPNAKWVQRFEGVLSKYPFLLPNIVGAGFCILSLIAVKLCVQETLPREKLQSPRFLFRDYVEQCICVCGRILSRPQNVQKYDALAQDDILPIKDIELTYVVSSAVGGEDVQENGESENDKSYYNNLQNIRLQHTESCIMLSTTTKPPLILEQHEVRQSDATSEATVASLWSRFDTRRHLIVFWVYSFVSVSLDEAFPLFCISKQAGLGLSGASIGKILSGSGLIFAICQYFVYTTIVNRFGLYGSIKLGSLVTVPLIALIPLSLWLNKGTEGGNLTWATFCYLSILMALSRIFGIAFYSSIAIAANRTVLASHRASMNGLSMLGGSIAKGVGPAFAGFLVAFSVSSGVFSPHVGAVFVFAVISFLAFMIAIPSANLVDTTSTVHDSDANNE